MKINNPGLVNLYEAVKIRDAAYQFIMDYKLTYPLKSVKLALRFANVCDYEYFVDHPPAAFNTDHLTVHQLRSRYGNGLVCKNGSCYLIAFDPLIPPSYIHWTLVHELSHIVLHHLYTDRILHAIPDNQFEMAADIFTLYVTCPDILLQKTGYTKSDQIATTFHIPHAKVKSYSDYLIFPQMSPLAKTSTYYKAFNYFELIYK